MRPAPRSDRSLLPVLALAVSLCATSCGGENESLQQALGTGDTGPGRIINPNVQADWFEYFGSDAGAQFSFTLALVDYGRERGYEARLTDDGQFELVDRRSAFAIDELAKACAENPGRWKELIEKKLGKWIDRLESFDDWTTPSWEEAKQQLFLKLYDDDFFAQGGYDDSNTLSRQDLPGVWTTIVFENEFAQITMPRAALKTWEKPEVTAFEVAARNTLAALENEEIERETRPIEGLTGVSLEVLSSAHAALAALTLDRYEGLVGRSGTLFILPVQQALYAVPLNKKSDARTIDALRGLAEASTGKAFHLSSDLFWRAPDGKMHRFDFTNEDAPWPEGFTTALR